MQATPNTSATLVTAASSSAVAPQQTMEAEVEQKVKDALLQFSMPNLLEQYFMDVIVQPSCDSLNARKHDVVREIVGYLRQVPPDIVDRVLRNVFASLNSSRDQALTLLTDILEGLLVENVMPAKNLCETVLSSLTPSSGQMWLDAFAFISKYLNRLDYKGSRDLLKLILPVVQELPVSVDENTLKLLEAAKHVIVAICDRKNNLLPAYFVINEIKKLYGEQHFYPQYMLADLFTDVLNSFRPLAQMVSVAGRPSFVPVGNHCGLFCNYSWKLDPFGLRIPLKGLLPYKQEYVLPQMKLMFGLMMQPNSRDLVTFVMSLSKEKVRCNHLEDVLISAILYAMELAETDKNYFRYSDRLWQHLSSQLIFFVLSQYTVFPRILEVLNEKLHYLPYRKGRDELMWMLLQFLSGGIQRSPVTEFNGIVDLYRLLYTGEEQLTINGSDWSCVRVMAPTCIWIHITKRAQSQQSQNYTVPQCINTQMKFLQEKLNNGHLNIGSDYIVSVLCNAYSTTSEIFQQRLLSAVITEMLSFPPGNMSSLLLPGNLQAESKQTSLTFEFLDSVTIHVKMNIVHHIFNQLVRYAQPVQQKPTVYPSPAAVDTYCRLLAYNEIDTLGARPFFAKLLPAAISAGCQDLLFMVVEILLYRFRIPTPLFKLQALLSVNHAATIPQLSCNAQLYWSMENLLVRGLMWLNSAEMVQVYPRLIPGLLGVTTGDSHMAPPQGLVIENEELAKLLVLAVARTVRLSGPEVSVDMYRDNVLKLLQAVPHGWSAVTLQNFPQVIADLYAGHQPILPTNKILLKQQTDEEYLKWRTLGHENNLMEYFTRQNAPPVFLCVVWRLVSEGLNVPPVTFRILEAIGARNMLHHIRCLVDAVVYELGNSMDGSKAQKCIDSLNDLIWKFGMVPMERFVLTLVLRNYDGNEVQVSLLLVHLLLQKAHSFNERLNYIVQHTNPDFWMCSDWFERHAEYHRKFPEKYWSEKLCECLGQQLPSQQTLPVYFGNCCLRFLPVLDLIVLRFCEQPQLTAKLLETLLENVGQLYKLHPQPTSFLYNTLYFCEKKIGDQPNIKRRLIHAVCRAFANIRPEGWLVTQEFLHYAEQPQVEIENFQQDQDYYIRVVERMVGCQKKPYHPPPNFDFNWRFSEFLNPMSQALHSVCVELMGLPLSPKNVGTSLIDLLLTSNAQILHEDYLVWLNCVGLILTALPISYSEAMFLKIIEVLHMDELKSSLNVFKFLDFESNILTMSDNMCCRLLGVFHSACHHATTGYLLWIPGFLRKFIKPEVRTEAQFIYVCHLVAPFLQRWHQEKVKFVMDVAVEIYEMLLNVDQNSVGVELLYEDNISDLLYHMKYMFVGDGIKTDTDRIISQLRPSLQNKLRYISHATSLQADTSTSLPPSVQSFSN